MIQREDVEPWITILHLEGHIVREECDKLETVFQELESENRWRVLLDLSAVGFLGRPAIILLLRQNRKALAHEGGVRLLRPNEVAKASFVSAQVSHLFETYRHRWDAVKSFGAPPTPAEEPSIQAPWTDSVEFHREALMQQHTISMLIAMLEDKRVLNPGEVDIRCAVAAEHILSSLRQRVGANSDH